MTETESARLMDDYKSGLWYRCREFIEEQSCGEWSDKDIADDTDKLLKFVMVEIRRSKALDALINSED